MKLSKREKETENLLKQGLTQRQIAYKLKITRRTVREYIKRINQKVGDKGIEKINKYLRKIHLYKSVLNDIEFIEENLNKNKIKGIQIIVHDDITDQETINYLRKYNSKDYKKTKIKFKLDYSKKYLQNNLSGFKESMDLAPSICKCCGRSL